MPKIITSLNQNKPVITLWCRHLPQLVNFASLKIQVTTQTHQLTSSALRLKCTSVLDKNGITIMHLLIKTTGLVLIESKFNITQKECSYLLQTSDLINYSPSLRLCLCLKGFSAFQLE